MQPVYMITRMQSECAIALGVRSTCYGHKIGTKPLTHPPRNVLKWVLPGAGYLIEEIAGMRCDTRNLLNVPRSRSSALVGSHALDLAVASRQVASKSRAVSE